MYVFIYACTVCVFMYVLYAMCVYVRTYVLQIILLLQTVQCTQLDIYIPNTGCCFCIEHSGVFFQSKFVNIQHGTHVLWQKWGDGGWAMGGG